MAQDSIRSFVAIELSAEVRRALTRRLDEFRGVDADVRWTRESNLHLTLQFLGNVEVDRLERTERALTAALASWLPFEIEVKGLGAFPSLRRPRVLWAGIDNGQVVELATTVHAALRTVDFEVEARPFRAHVTLGRVRSLRGWEKMRPRFDAYLDDVFGRCTIDRVVMFRSTLQRDGSVYTPLWEVGFRRTEG